MNYNTSTGRLSTTSRTLFPAERAAQDFIIAASKNPQEAIAKTFVGRMRQHVEEAEKSKSSDEASISSESSSLWLSHPGEVETCDFLAHQETLTIYQNKDVNTNCGLPKVWSWSKCSFITVDPNYGSLIIIITLNNIIIISFILLLISYFFRSINFDNNNNQKIRCLWL